MNPPTGGLTLNNSLHLQNSDITSMRMIVNIIFMNPNLCIFHSCNILIIMLIIIPYHQAGTHTHNSPNRRMHSTIGGWARVESWAANWCGEKATPTTLNKVRVQQSHHHQHVCSDANNISIFCQPYARVA